MGTEDVDLVCRVCRHAAGRRAQHAELLATATPGANAIARSCCKRSPSATVKEWLLAAEYLLAGGNPTLCSASAASAPTIRTRETPSTLRPSRWPSNSRTSRRRRSLARHRAPRPRPGHGARVRGGRCRWRHRGSASVPRKSAIGRRRSRSPCPEFAAMVHLIGQPMRTTCASNRRPQPHKSCARREAVRGSPRGASALRRSLLSCEEGDARVTTCCSPSAACYHPPHSLHPEARMDSITLRVNGRDRQVAVSPDTPLLWVLRDTLDLTGTKFGCGVGTCGACTVHVDGDAVRSCTHASFRRRWEKDHDHRRAVRRAPHPLQLAWIAEDVPQCGYCQSGQIMQAAALLAKKPHPSETEVLEAMNGNLCRCGTYQRIRNAIAARRGRCAMSPISRRDFLATSATATAGLVIALHLPLSGAKRRLATSRRMPTCASRPTGRSRSWSPARRWARGFALPCR